MSVFLSTPVPSGELFDKSHSSIPADLLSPVSPPSSPNSKGRRSSHSTSQGADNSLHSNTRNSHISSFGKQYLPSHSSSTTALKLNSIPSISPTSDSFSSYPASLNGSSTSIVDPRSLGYFQNSPLVRRNSSSVPNLTINTKSTDKAPSLLSDFQESRTDFDFSSDAAPSGSRRTSLLSAKQSTPSAAKSVRYTPTHKKSFSIHEITQDTPYSMSASNSGGADALTPPTSPVAYRFQMKSASTSQLNTPASSNSLQRIGNPSLPMKLTTSGSSDRTHSNIPRPRVKLDHLATSHSEQNGSNNFEVQESRASLSNNADNRYASNTRPNMNGNANENTHGNNNNNNPNSNEFLESLPNSQPATGYPFLRALHGFDASSLSADISDPDENPASICLSFQESEIVLLHTIHPSGWGDATILSTGVRGWIPTNYFTPYTDSKVTPLLSAVLNFVLSPKSHPLQKAEDAPPSAEVEHTFSQSSITSIVAGVRSLLEACGTLTRDTQIVRRSQSIRKFRKILLAELAILVSLAKQYRNTTEDANIERLVTGSYKIISRAVVFLDIWTIDTSNPGPPSGDQTTLHSSFISGTPSIDNLHSTPSRRPDNSSRADTYNSTTIETIPEVQSGSDESNNVVHPIPARTNRSANRESVIFHSQPPYAKQRLDEVNDALTSYLGNFIHRMTVLEVDPTACTQILVNTRKSMLACRELLAAVESISSRSLPRNKDLENCKDKLFGQIRLLVTAARDVVATNPLGDLKQGHDDEDPVPKPRQKAKTVTTRFGEEGKEDSPEGQRLIDIATDCARTSGECVVRCRHILEKIGDFQLSTNREYPDFSDGIIAVSNGRKRTSLIIPYGVGINPSPSSVTFSPYGSNDESDSLATPISPLGSMSYGRGSSSTSKLQNYTDSSSSNITRDSPKISDTNSSMLPHIPSLSPLIPVAKGESNNPYYGGTLGSIDTTLRNGPNSPGFADGFEDSAKHPSHSTSRIPAVMEEEDDQLRDDENENQSLAVTLDPEDQIIIDENGRVRGGSLEGLVKVLTDESVDQDPTFLSTFFLTFRQFSNSLDLAEALVRRYGSQLDENEMDSEDIEALVTRRTKVYNIFKRWMESHWKHSVDVVILPQIVNFANSQVLDIPNAKTVLNDLASRVQQVPEGESIVPRFISVPGSHSTRMTAQTYSHTPMVGSNVNKHLAAMLAKAVEQSDTADTDVDDDNKSIQSTSGSGSAWSNSLRMVKANGLGSSTSTVSILDIDAADIARQLTLIDSQLFCMIKPEELLDLNFSLKRRHLGIAVNVNAMTLRSNQLSSFVGDSILSGDVPAKTRRNLLKQWIKICEKCHELRNFNSLMTIISALQSVNIMRLKKTWELLSPRYMALFNELKNMMSVEKNYGQYRAMLRTNEIPTIPYLGLYLTDLTFVTEGNSTHRLLVVDVDGKVVPPGRKPSTAGGRTSTGARSSTMVINFDRYERTARIIGEVQNFQIPYRIMPSVELQNWLKLEMVKALSSVSKDHNNLWRRSCLVEPK